MTISGIVFYDQPGPVLSLLAITDLTIRINGRPLLEEASLTLEKGQHIGLIGRNGTGKSTLLAAIAGDITPDSGHILRASHTSMGRVKQETPSGDLSLLETVLQSHEERNLLLRQAEMAGEQPENFIQLADIHERLLAIDAHTAPARASSILSGLGFDHAAQQRPVSSFSGGWRMRVALASALFLAPDLLLLDEPTNHLDVEATLWLESWLKRFSGTVLMVSHDRALLDHSVDGIAHLENGKISLTPGNYERFVQIRTEQALHQNRAARRVAEQREKMEDFVARFRAKATKAKQAQARLKALAKLPQIESVVEGASTEFSFPSPDILPPPIIRLDHVSVGYDGRAVLSNLSLRLDMEDRIALLGRNGHGKSTFAKLLSGQIEAMSGEIFTSSRLRIGYFAQHQSESLIAEQSPFEHMAQALPKATPVGIRAQLARFGLDSDRADTVVASLSGGEKARLLLSLATRHAPHLLLLDEPTNHLDLDARDALIRALGNFEGAVILISHDSYLVDSVAERLWIADKGTITPFDGDMEEYRNLLERQMHQASASASKTSSSQSRSAAHPERANLKEQKKEQTRRLAPLRRKLRDLENRIESLLKKKLAIERKLADPELYQSDKGQPDRAGTISALNTERTILEKQLEETEFLWLSAQEELESGIIV